MSTERTAPNAEDQGDREAAVIDGRTWLEWISPPKCRDLLAANVVGRIGVLVDSAPEIYPVNYAFDGDSILFKTAAGSKLRGVLRSPSVCFEIDGLDLEEHTGWSVMVKGRATELTSAEELSKAELHELTLWSVGEKTHWIRLSPDDISGRRIHRKRD